MGRPYVGKRLVYSPGAVVFYDQDKIGAIKPYPHVSEKLSAHRDRGLKPGVITDAHNGNALKWLRQEGADGC